MARPLATPVSPLQWVYCFPHQAFVIDDHALAMMAEDDFEAQLDRQSPPGDEAEDVPSFDLME